MNEKLQNPEYTVRKPWAVYAACILGICALGVVGWRYWTDLVKTREAAAKKPAVEQTQSAPDPWASTYAGRVRAKKTIRIAAPIEGILEGVDVVDGQEVFEGQQLARINNTSLAAAKEKAEIELATIKSKVADLESQILAARLEVSRAQADVVRVRGEAEAAAKALERQTMLYKEGATARKLYEGAQADFARLTEERKTAESTVRRAESQMNAVTNNLEESKKRLKDREDVLEGASEQIQTGDIKSPADGILIAHKKSSGEEVTRDVQDLFEIAVDLTQLEIVVDLPPVLAGKVVAGRNVLVTIAEGGNAPLDGRVREVQGTLALIDFFIPSPAVRPGLTARVRFLEGAK